MKRSWKRFLALCLSVLMLTGLLTACGGDAGTAQTPTEPKETQTPEEAKVLKVLTLGHSLALDSGHMLALVAGAEGYENLVVGTLYYSGCSITEHMMKMNSGVKDYDLYLSSTDTAKEPPTIRRGISMEEALVLDHWDIVVMQGGVFEIAKESVFNTGFLQKIQEFVREKVEGPDPVFAWHMFWAAPIDNSLRDQYPHTPNTYYSNYDAFNQDRTTLYNSIASAVANKVETDSSFAFVIPSGTAIENALSGYLEEKDLHRDYVHASDLGRVISSYTWYCRIAGIDKLDSIKLNSIPRAFLVSTPGSADRVLTQKEKDIILESVNNALANPYQMTQSQYTKG